jgi:uncharacterized protein (TIGR03083 family)
MAAAGVELLDTLVVFGRRFVDMVRSLDPARPVPGSAWTIGETVAHVASGVGAYVTYLAGDTTPRVDLSDVPGGSIAASNARRLATDAERDVSTLAATIEARLAELVAAARQMDLDDVVSWHGRDVALRTMLATAIGELAMHGRDIARAVDHSWPLSRRDAVIVLTDLAPLLPVLVDPATTASLDAVIRLRLRGGPELALAFDHGTLAVGPATQTSRHPDVTVSADPVAFLLVAYGRASQWPAIATGKLAAWGRRPWLALRLTSYLVRP